MNRDEAIGRRYCAFRGDNPDEIYMGKPMWEHGLEDIRASISVLESLQIYVDWTLPGNGECFEQMSLDLNTAHNIVSFSAVRR